MSELRELARFLTGLSLDRVPDRVKQTAWLCIQDTIGAAVGGSGNKQFQEVSKMYFGISGNRGPACLWGMNQKVPLLTAVFLNAMMGHTLELDDVHTGSKTHIGTVVVPAAWGMAEYLGKDQGDLLLAVICGYETMSRIGMALGVSAHRNKGWHVTATAGTFGAAAACGKLLGLGEEEMISALGMAGTQSFGLWAFLEDGAGCKVLHPARAAASGTEAALLAKAGMTGPESILTAGDGGLLAAMSDSHDVSLVSRDLGSVWQIQFMDNKPYPCCRSTHCAIDGTLELCRTYHLKREDIRQIVIKTYLVGNKQCGMSKGSKDPENAVDAKFSTPFTVACAVIFGSVGLEQFSEETIQNRDVRELLKKVEVVTEERFTAAYPDHWGCQVVVTLKDGRILKQEIKDAAGSADNPITEEGLKEKIKSLLLPMGEKSAERYLETLFKLGDGGELPFL